MKARENWAQLLREIKSPKQLDKAILDGLLRSDAPPERSHSSWLVLAFAVPVVCLLACGIARLFTDMPASQSPVAQRILAYSLENSLVENSLELRSPAAMDELYGKQAGAKLFRIPKVESEVHPASAVLPPNSVHRDRWRLSAPRWRQRVHRLQRLDTSANCDATGAMVLARMRPGPLSGIERLLPRPSQLPSVLARMGAVPAAEMKAFPTVIADPFVPVHPSRSPFGQWVAGSAVIPCSSEFGYIP